MARKITVDTRLLEEQNRKATEEKAKAKKPLKKGTKPPVKSVKLDKPGETETVSVDLNHEIILPASLEREETDFIKTVMFGAKALVVPVRKTKKGFAKPKPELTGYGNFVDADVVTVERPVFWPASAAVMPPAPEKKARKFKPAEKAVETPREEPRPAVPSAPVHSTSFLLPKEQRQSARPIVARMDPVDGGDDKPRKKYGQKGRAATGGKSKRVRLFELLDKHPGGLNNQEIRAKLATNNVAMMCRDEAVYGRLLVLVDEMRKGRVFTLSKKGKAALANGTVDSDKAPPGEFDEDEM